jgi:hypothetical protein
MGTFHLFFQSGRAKDLSAPLYIVGLSVNHLGLPLPRELTCGEIMKYGNCWGWWEVSRSERDGATYGGS